MEEGGRGMNFKRLICKIFGHRFGWERYESVEYVTMGTRIGVGVKSKRRRKKKVVRIYRRCKRCGAMIMVRKYKQCR